MIIFKNGNGSWYTRKSIWDDNTLLIQNNCAFIVYARIEKAIKNAELIICDISEKSLNVFYELWYARAKNKTIIMTAKKGTELPFDVRQYKTNFYDSALHLQKIVVKELNAYYK